MIFLLCSFEFGEFNIVCDYKNSFVFMGVNRKKMCGKVLYFFIGINLFVENYFYLLFIFWFGYVILY